MKKIVLSVLFAVFALASSALTLPDTCYPMLTYNYSFGYYYRSISCFQSFRDEEGNDLDPHGFEIAMWVDGEIYTFDPVDGYNIKEPMTWIPFGFYDSDNDVDKMSSMIWFMDSTPYLAFKEFPFKEVGVQFRYTSKDGETTYSNIVYVDEWNHQRIEQNPFTSIDNICADHTAKVQKRMVGNKIVIHKDGHDYTVDGRM